MDELLEQFLIESRELIAVAADDFTTLARNPQGTRSIDSAFRAIHTLKGSVTLFAMAPAERVLHAAEDVLERARKGTSELGEGTVAALVSCLDQVDRWVDDLERSGGLLPDAPRLANELAHALSSDLPAAPVMWAAMTAADAGWVANLCEREAAIIADAAQPLTAFRYAPDGDCFFRGDDPLAVVAAVPELLALAIMPCGGTWPEPGAVEPFSCFSILEGISAASTESVSAAFRMMPDQVAFAAIDPPARHEQAPGIERETPSARSLRVDSARIDALGDALGELLVAINGIASLADQAGPVDRTLAADIRAVHADVVRVTGYMAEMVSALRAVTLASTLKRLPRLVRDTARGLHKPIDFTITGQDIEIDKQVADGLFEPLLHLLRNAIDHGIEDHDRRVAAGKAPAGKVSLGFHRESDMIVVQLVDDGAGMDAGQIRAAALARGAIDAEAAAALSDADALRLIFAPGFSTAAKVTEISGRGVGMNAVETAVAALHGTIDIDSTPGMGTTISMRFPVNALTTRLLLIEVGGDRYGVALAQVIESVGVSNDKLMRVGENLVCVLHGRTVPVLSLAALLGVAEREMPNSKLLITRSGGEIVALRIGAFGGRIDVQVRRSTGMLAAVHGVIGTALMSDGKVLLVLDLSELAA